MEIKIEFAYLTLSIIFLVVWAILFAISRLTRKEQLTMSLLLAPLGPVSQIFYLQDYWDPISPFSIGVFGQSIFLEDFIFAFAVGGIGSVLHRAFTKKEFVNVNVPLKLNFIWVLGISGVVGIGVFLLGLNSIFSSSLGAVVGAALMLVQRKDLVRNSLSSGLLLAMLVFVVYLTTYYSFLNWGKVIADWWQLYETGFDIRILNIPLTELIWAFSMGLFVGPLYEFANKLGYRTSQGS